MCVRVCGVVFVYLSVYACLSFLTSVRLCVCVCVSVCPSAYLPVCVSASACVRAYVSACPITRGLWSPSCISKVICTDDDAIYRHTQTHTHTHTHTHTDGSDETVYFSERKVVTLD